jgi:hypothetical protein
MEAFIGNLSRFLPSLCLIGGILCWYASDVVPLLREITREIAGAEHEVPLPP